MDIHVVIALYDPWIVPYKTWKLIFKIFQKLAICRQIAEGGTIKLRTWRKNCWEKKDLSYHVMVISTIWHKQWHLLPPTTKLKWSWLWQVVAFEA